MVCGKPERTLTLHEVADLLGVSVEDVRRYTLSGELRSYQPAGHDEVRVRPADLERFLRASESASSDG